MKLINTFGSATRCVKPILFSLAIALSLPGLSSAAPFGRYFSTPTEDTIVGTWNDASPTVFNRNVVAPTGQVRGTIAFDYDPYKGQGPTPTLGGAGLSGGFYMASGVSVIPGYTLNWVQTVQSNHAGENQFNLPDVGAGEFPDADPTDAAAAAFRATQGLPVLNPTFAPAYVFTTTSALNAPTTAPTLGYTDYPGRNFADGNQTWTAELGLVAISNVAGMDGFRTVDVVGTFLWGFNITTGPNAAGAFSPNLWSPPTASFLSILNDYYDGMSPSIGGNTGVATDKYKFVFEPAVFVPEPGSLVLLALGTVCILVIGRRRRAKAHAA